MQSSNLRVLEAWITREMGDVDSVHIGDVQGAKSGLSNETRLMHLTYRRGGEETSETLVFRTNPPGRGQFPDYDLGHQFRITRALAATSLPVPGVRWFEGDSSLIGAPFYFMEMIEGSVVSDTPPGMHGTGLFFDASPADRAALWYESLGYLARLHAVDWTALDLPPMIGRLPGKGDPLDQQLALYRRWLAWSGLTPPPIMAKALDWLTENKPADYQLCLLWGDGRPGNILYRDGKVAGMIDWELATIGPPELDLIYFVWVSDMIAQLGGREPLAGLPDLDQSIRHYEACRGAPIRNRAYMEILMATRVSIMNGLGVRSSQNDSYSMDMYENNILMRRLRERLD